MTSDRVSTTRGANTDGARVPLPANPPLYRKNLVSYRQQYLTHDENKTNFIHISMTHEDAFLSVKLDKTMARDQYGTYLGLGLGLP